MKVKNIMFSGFAAAVLAGACGAADAATYTLASKDYVTNQLATKQNKLTAGEGIDIKDDTISADLSTATVQGADGTQVPVSTALTGLTQSVTAVEDKLGDLPENTTVADALGGKQDALSNASVLESITQDTVDSIGETAGAVADLEATVGEVAEGKTVVQMIEEATYDDTELAGRVTGLETEVGDVPEAGWQIGTTTAKNIVSAVEALRVKTENVATTEGLGQIESKIATLDGDVSTEGSVKYQVNAALEAAKQYANENDADTIYDDTALAGRVTALEGAGYLTEATADTMYDGIGSAAAVQNALDTYKQTVSTELAGKQATIENLATIESGAAAGASALQPGADISKLNNDSGYQTAAQVEATIEAGNYLSDTMTEDGSYLVTKKGDAVSYASVSVIDGQGNVMTLQ